MSQHPVTEEDFAPVGTLLIVGLGLIGGALARAVRKRGLARRIVAVGRRPDDMDMAVQAGVIDSWSADLAASAAKAELIVLARPVELIPADAAAVLAVAPYDSIVTDAGSTKSAIVAAGEAAQRPDGARFVGSHPMAGSDKTGWRHGTAHLFEGATAIVTVTDRTNPAAAARVGAFWKALGSRLVYCHPRRHDELIGLVSHLPHMVAVGLADHLADFEADAPLLNVLAGPGLRDTTRVAGGDPELWRQICLQNPDVVAEALERTGARLQELAALIRAGDGQTLRTRLERAKALRQGLD